MINCKSCGFKVDNKFKFSILNNSCPVCGGGILEEEKHEMLKYMIETMSNQDFAKKIGQDMISEISSFIFFEFLDVDEPLGEDIAEDQQFYEGEEETSKAIPEELNVAEEDVSSKAERLRSVYKNDIKKMKSKTGVKVSRVST